MTATHLTMAPGPESHILYTGWRDGRVYAEDLGTEASFRDLGFDLSRRAARCAGPAPSVCGRVSVSEELTGLALLNPEDANHSLLVGLDGCSHVFVLDGTSGCTRSVGEGLPNSGSPTYRVFGPTTDETWVGGQNGMIYSIP